MIDRKLRVADLEAAPGQRVAAVVTIPVAGIDLDIPIVLINGAETGPVLCVTAGIHGAEYASIEAAVRLGQELDPGSLRVFLERRWKKIATRAAVRAYEAERAPASPEP